MVRTVAIVLFSGVVLAQTFPVVQAGNWVQVVLLVGTIIGSAWRVNSQLKKIHEKTFLISVEHEMLVSDYCERKSMKPHELPTRQSRIV